MHELSIIQGIIAIINKEKEKHNFSKVNFIEIVCGRFNCASEENLQFCYDALADEGYLNGAKIRLKRLDDNSDVYLDKLDVD